MRRLPLPPAGRRSSRSRRGTGQRERREQGGRGERTGSAGLCGAPAVPSAGPVLALAVPVPAVKKHAAKPEFVIGPVKC